MSRPIQFEIQSSFNPDWTFRGDIFDRAGSISVGIFFVLFRGKVDITHLLLKVEVEESIDEFVDLYNHWREEKLETRGIR